MIFTDVLSSYADLKAEASETTLRNFLTIFKNNAEQIQDAVDTLTPSTAQQHEGNNLTRASFFMSHQQYNTYKTLYYSPLFTFSQLQYFLLR